MGDSPSHLRPPLRWIDSLRLLLFAVVGNLILVANPGYFSHDELQKFDHVERHGLSHYLAAYVSIPQTATLSRPVRPVGFVHQGLVAPWLHSSPLAVHLIDVLIHALVCIALWSCLLQLRLPARLAWWAAALFALSPLTTLATGWVAASMDRFYVLFVLLALLQTIRMVRDPLDWRGCVLLMLAAALAILSKETAVMLPLVVMATALLVDHRPCPVIARAQRAIALAVVAAVPMLIYLGLRLPALLGTLAGNDGAGYSSSLANVDDNLVTYFAYPFLLDTVETSTVALLPTGTIGVALAWHLAVLGLIGWRWGIARAAMYLAAYWVFLMPVLALRGTGGHYCYFSAIPLAVALAALALDGWNRRHFLQLLVTTPIVTLLLWHSLEAQSSVYRTGACQRNVEWSVRAQLHSAGDAGVSLQIVPQPFAPAHVAIRSLFGRDDFWGLGPSRFYFPDANTRPPAGTPLLEMGVDCLLYPPRVDNGGVMPTPPLAAAAPPQRSDPHLTSRQDTAQ